MKYVNISLKENTYWILLKIKTELKARTWEEFAIKLKVIVDEHTKGKSVQDCPRTNVSGMADENLSPRYMDY